MIIVPSIEETSVVDYAALLSRCAQFAPRIQLDFNDGSFADFKTVTVKEVISQTEVYAADVFLEAHLMVQKPTEWLEDVVKAGFRKVIFQYEIDDDLRTVLEKAADYDLELGLALAPETTTRDIEPFLDLVTSITVMTIHPGKQGQKFMPETLEKVRELTEGNFSGDVQVDGGINLETVKQVLDFAPTQVVVGSYIVKDSQPEERYEELVSVVGSN